MSMSSNYNALTEKEKETLRLLVRGHDTKTIARHFDLSVHTINERLRNARQKMAVSSSRQAARRLLKMEGDHPSLLADKFLGEAKNTNNILEAEKPENGRGLRISLAALTGVIIMSLLFATLAFLSTTQNSAPVTEDTQRSVKTEAPIAATEVTESARQWLALVDDYNWLDSWNTAGSSFKALNTSKVWASTAQNVQPALGAVVSRIVSSQEAIPAPPYGLEMVKFRTSFANKPDATETLTLVREDSTWKVVGYWID